MSFTEFFAVHTALPWIFATCIGLLTCYYVAQQTEHIRRLFLIASGVIILAVLDIWSFILLSVLALVTFILSKKIATNKKLFIIAFFCTLTLLLTIKTVAPTANSTAAFSISFFGSSYYLFRIISFMVEVYKGNKSYIHFDTLNYITWIFFPPILAAGPIMRFHELKIVDSTPNHSKILKACSAFFFFLFLKLVLIDNYMHTFTYTYALTAAREVKSILSLFIFGAGGFLHAYLDLMLYTELSKALARFFGFSTVENFQRPLLATNISQFWQRWHMSLSNWTRDYVFFPTLIKTRKPWLAAYASMLVVGMWHHISWNWLIWALCHGTALNAYTMLRGTRYFTQMQRSSVGKIVLKVGGSLFVLSFVSSVFIFVAFDNFTEPYTLLRDCFLHYRNQ